MEKDEIIDNLLEMLKKHLDGDFRQCKNNISFPVSYKKILIEFNHFITEFELKLSSIEKFKNDNLSEKYIKDYCHRHNLKKEFKHILIILNTLKSIYQEIKSADINYYGKILVSKYKNGFKYFKYILTVDNRLNNLIEKIKKDKIGKKFVLFYFIRKLKNKEKQK